MPIGACLSIGWSFIIGYPLFKLKGHYFAIATIAHPSCSKTYSKSGNSSAPPAD